MKRLVCITALCIVSLLPAFAAAAERNDLTRALRGVYAFSGEGSCLGSPLPGFNSNFRTSTGGVIRSFSVHGIRRFNGDGTGSVSGRIVLIGHNGPPANPAGTNLGPYITEDFSAQSTYTIASDHTIRIENGPLTTTRVEGPNVGDTDVATGIKIEGHVSQDFKTIVVATPSSVLETRYNTLADALNGQNPIEYRRCHRSRTLIRISEGHVERERGNSRFPF
jgi:hypothetical protein